MSQDKLCITTFQKRKGLPTEIRVNQAGTLFIDGVPYDEKQPYKGLYVNMEKHRKVETGEEMEKMMEASKTAQKGETVVITDVGTPNKTKKTSVTF